LATAEATTSLSLIVAHSINSTGAITLRSALAIVQKLRAGGDDLVLVSSDQRLLRAAQAEGLLTFNPENQDQAWRRSSVPKRRCQFMRSWSARIVEREPHQFWRAG